MDIWIYGYGYGVMDKLDRSYYSGLALQESFTNELKRWKEVYDSSDPMRPSTSPSPVQHLHLPSSVGLSGWSPWRRRQRLFVWKVEKKLQTEGRQSLESFLGERVAGFLPLHQSAMAGAWRISETLQRV